MKKFVALIVCVVLCVSAFTIGINNQNFKNGSAIIKILNRITRPNSIVVSSSEGALQGVASMYGDIEKDSKGNYYLTGNIIVSDSSELYAVEAALCNGKIFDGKGYKITTSTTLFGTLTGGTVKNLTIDGNITSASDDSYASVISNNITGPVTFHNVRSEVNIAFTPSKGTVFSGFVGNVSGLGGSKIIFDECVFAGRLESRSSKKSSAAGGFIGELEYSVAEFTDCTSDGTILVSGNTGGFIAEATDETDVSFNNCVSDMDLDMSIRSQTRDIGGFVGYSKGNITANDIFVSGVMDLAPDSHNSSRYAGGVIGHWNASSSYNTLSIADCTSSVLISSPRAVMLGGVIGCVSAAAESIDLKNCTFSGKIEYPVSNANDSTAGAIIGYISANVTNIDITGCKNVSDTVLLLESGAFSVAGMIGKLQGLDSSTTLTFEGCTNLGDVTVNCYSSTALGGSTCEISVGGFVGLCNASCNIIIKGCENQGNVETYLYNVSSVISNGIAGGFIGNITKDARLTVSNSNNAGKIISKGRTGAPTSGGLIGYYGGTHISVVDFCNSGDVISTAWNGKGHSYSESNIVSVGDPSNGVEGSASSVAYSSRTAGIVGYSESLNYALFESCMNVGNITSENLMEAEAYVGGLCSSVTGNGTFIRCLNSGKINLNTSNKDQLAGGIVGERSSDITFEYCVNLGDVESLSTHTGALFGTSDASELTGIKNCVNAGQITDYDGLIADTVLKKFYSELPSYCIPDVRRSTNTDAYIALILSAISYDMNGTDKNFDESLISDYMAELDVFTVTKSVNAENVFMSTIDKNFYDALENIAGDSNVMYDGIVTRTSYVSKLGGFTHHIFDEFYEKYKSKLPGIDSLYMDADRNEQNISDADINSSGDSYEVKIRLKPQANESIDYSKYSANAYIQIGNSYIYGTIE